MWEKEEEGAFLLRSLEEIYISGKSLGTVLKYWSLFLQPTAASHTFVKKESFAIETSFQWDHIVWKSSKKSHFSKASEASLTPQASHQPPKAATVRVVLWHIWDNINDFRTLCSILEDSISTQRKYVDLRSNQKILPLLTRRSIQKVLMGSSKLYLHLTSRKIGSLSTS